MRKAIYRSAPLLDLWCLNSMLRTIAVMLLASASSSVCLGQDARRKEVPKECAKAIRLHGAFPKGPFHSLSDESYKGSPIIKYQIREDGNVSSAVITRSSGVADIDKKVLEAVERWKYKPRSPGCGVIETEMSVTLDPAS
jgi:TonB family protein